MPYNLPNSIGGDSQENTAKMESCVKELMTKGKSRSSAIAICKASLIKANGSMAIARQIYLKETEGR